ncbi:MAG: hypothetical protein JWN25_3024 [Verrucomicrobiales bacterium]|nr:hypothetical protein [Verrucomicrobiales bacterium]
MECQRRLILFTTLTGDVLKGGMESHRRHTLPKWPFFLADLVLLTFAAVSMLRVGGPNTSTDRLIWIGTVCIGCLISLVPYLYTGASSSENTSAADDERLEELKLAVQNSGEKLPDLLVPHLDKMQAALHERFLGIEAGVQASRKSFDGLITVLNQQQSAELAHARLETEKLRKGDGEWLQLVVHLMDQAFALFQAAVNSGQHAVAQQLSLYYSHCRDLVRRKGLVPLLPEPGTPFNGDEQMITEGTRAAEDSKIASVVVPGYTFQKQIVRKALVTLALSTPSPVEAPAPVHIEEVKPEIEPEEPIVEKPVEPSAAESQESPAEQASPVEVIPTEDPIPEKVEQQPIDLEPVKPAEDEAEKLPLDKPERKRRQKASEEKPPGNSEPQGFLL